MRDETTFAQALEYISFKLRVSRAGFWLLVRMGTFSSGLIFAWEHILEIETADYSFEGS